MRTLSLTELRNIPRVVERLTELIGGSGAEAPDHAALAAAREGTTEFGGNYYDQIDLYGFAEKFDFPAAARLKEAVSAAVVISGRNFLGANGLSFYFPFRYPYAYESNALGTLRTLGFPAGYTDRLRAFARDIAETASGGIRPPAWYDPDEEYTYTSEGTSTLKAEKNKNGETVVRFGLYDYMTAEDVIMHLSVFDGESWIELGRDCMYEFNDDGDLVYDEDPYWMTLDGLLVPFTVLCDRENGNGDFYSYGRVRMLLNGEEDVDLIVYWDNTYCGGYVAGYRYPEGKKEELYALRPGDVLEAVVDSYTPEGKYEGEYIWGDPIKITDGRVEVDYEPIDYFDVRVSYRVIFRDGHAEQTEEVTFDARYDL